MDTLHPVRQLLVACMDSEAKAAWRACCSAAASDVYDTTTALAFKRSEDNASCCMAPEQLPTALLAKCPRLQQLRCTGLSTLQGLPPNITTLDLSRCECLSNLAPLHQLTSLSTLSMEGEYECTAEQPQQLSAALERLPSLQHLQLQRCADRWPEAAAATMYPALASLTNLQTLHIIGHHLSTDAVAGIAAALQSLPHLTHLALRSTYFGSQGAVILAPALSTLAAHGKLARLELRCNWMRVRGADALAPALALLAPSLSHLDLSENALAPAGVAMLLPVLASMRRLTELHLARNGCDEQGAQAIADILSRNTDATNAVESTLVALAPGERHGRLSASVRSGDAAGSGNSSGSMSSGSSGGSGSANSANNGNSGNSGNSGSSGKVDGSGSTGGAEAALPCLSLLDLRGNNLEACAAAVTRKLVAARVGQLQLLL